jgi:hypothetical protein
MREATVLIVPGLRDHVPGHWQTLLASRLPRVRAVMPMGRDNLDCLVRVNAIEEAAAGIDGPIILVAHSGGVIAVTHWARLTTRKVLGALLATPADLDQPLPEGYPSIGALEGAAGCRCRATNCRSAASSQPAAMIRWLYTIGSRLSRAPGEASWSIWARSAISIQRPALANGHEPRPSSTKSSQPPRTAG